MRSDSGGNRNERGIGLQFAWNGLRIMRQERNFRIHMIVALLVIVLGIFFRLNTIEWSIIIITINMVLTLEILNTSIEMFLDYVKPDFHPTAKVIKDVAAGAVLVSAIAAVIIGLLIFLPKIYHLF